MDLRQPPPQTRRVAPQKKKKHFLRNFLVVFFAVIVTSLGVNATDNIGNLSNSILGSVVSSVVPGEGPCPEGMALVSSPEEDFCIDIYEASTSEDCEYGSPRSIQETHTNINTEKCKPVSEPGRIPWTNISQNQAIEVCAKAGKHLPSNQEWFLGSLGTPDLSSNWGKEDCNVASNWDTSTFGESGFGTRCKSSAGAYDMIGNVWEWTFETFNKGMYQNTELPAAGYVQGVTRDGVPMETSDDASNLYYYDRFWIDDTITSGVFRGGYWGSETDAGRFAVHGEVPPSFSGNAVGFRCAVSAK